MQAAPDTLGTKAENAFWKVWEKLWLPIALGFFALNYWIGNRIGALKMGRAWAAIFFLIGLAAMLHGLRSKKRAQTTSSWTPTEARIVSSKVSVQRGMTDDEHPATKFYSPSIRYEYAVQGLTYTSWNYLLIDVNFPKAEAEAIAASYPAGGRAIAYVDPANPRNAVLKPGLEGNEGQYNVMAIAGAMFMAVGAAAWLAMPFITRK